MSLVRAAESAYLHLNRDGPGDLPDRRCSNRPIDLHSRRMDGAGQEYEQVQMKRWAWRIRNRRAGGLF